MKEWKESMGEISGFGGGYEAVCRAMVLAGINWIDEHPNCVLEASSYKGVFGIAHAESEDMKKLEKVILDAPVYLNGKLIQKRAGDDCTGAMHHGALSHCMHYKKLGWDEYVRQLEAREEK